MPSKFLSHLLFQLFIHEQPSLNIVIYCITLVLFTQSYSLYQAPVLVLSKWRWYGLTRCRRDYYFDVKMLKFVMFYRAFLSSLFNYFYIILRWFDGFRLCVGLNQLENLVIFQSSVLRISITKGLFTNSSKSNLGY